MEDKGFDYINIIPLVDVMLVLLTIVLTTSTFISTGAIHVNLPVASKGAVETLKTQNIEIDRNGNVYFNSRPTTLGQLKSVIQTINKSSQVVISADRAVPFQACVDVLDILKGAGISKVGIQTIGK